MCVPEAEAEVSPLRCFLEENERLEKLRFSVAMMMLQRPSEWIHRIELWSGQSEEVQTHSCMQEREAVFRMQYSQRMTVGKSMGQDREGRQVGRWTAVGSELKCYLRSAMSGQRTQDGLVEADDKKPGNVNVDECASVRVLSIWRDIW